MSTDEALASRTPKRAGYVKRGRRNQHGQTMGVKGLQTRRRLMEATDGLLQTTPLRELRVAHIVKAAETSSATFYLYFQDVSEVVLALIGEFNQTPPVLLETLAVSWDGPRGRALGERFVETYIATWRSRSALLRVRNLACDEGDIRFADARRAAVVDLMHLMAARIVERQTSGDLPATLNPNASAGALLAMLERIAVLPEAMPSLLPQEGQASMRSAAVFFAMTLFGGEFDDSKKLTDR